MAQSQILMNKSELDAMKKYVDLRYFYIFISSKKSIGILWSKNRYKYYEKHVFKQLPRNMRGVGGI